MDNYDSFALGYFTCIIVVVITAIFVHCCIM